MTPLSPAVKHRRALAERLAAACPPELGADLALTGSTARGAADDESDLELNLWDDTLPPPQARLAWLVSVGAGSVTAEAQPRPDGSEWIGGELGSIHVEIGWQTRVTLENELNVLRSGSILDRKRLALAEIIHSAVPLRGNWLPTVQAELSRYSDALAARLIDAALARWTPEHWHKLHRLALHEEQIELNRALLDDLDALTRLLYAVNRRWEPAPKWTLTVARALPRLPRDFETRLAAVFAAPPQERIERCMALTREGVELVP